MGKIALLYDNKSDAAEFSGGSWSLPLTNLTSQPLEEIARSASALPADTRLQVALTSPEAMPAIVLGPTNLSVAYQYRIRGFVNGELDGDGYYDPDFGGAPGSGANLAYAGTWVAPFEETVAGALELEWEDPNFWLGLVPYDDAERGIWLIHIMESTPVAQFWSIEIDDAQNAAGFVQAGRLFMPSAWKPSINYSYQGNLLSFANNGFSAKTLGGQTRHWRRTNPRRYAIQFDYLPEGEGFGDAYRLARVVGFDGEVFVIPDPEDATHLQERSFLATFTEFSGLAQNAFAHVGTGFQLEEIL